MQVHTIGTAYSRNCISVYTNLVTKSQSHTKSHDFYEKHEVFHWIRSVVVLRILWRVCGCFDMKLKGKQKKNFRTVYNLLSYRNTALSSDIVLKLILWLDQSSIDAACCSHFTPATKCWAVWKCSWLRTSEFAISAGLFFQEVTIFLRSFAQQLKTTLLDSPHGSSVVSLQLESLTL